MSVHKHGDSGPGCAGSCCLKVNDLGVNFGSEEVLHDVSFQAHAGQITGFAGLVGAGRTETMRAVFGADKLDSGEVYVKGEKVHIRSPKDAIQKKIA